MRKGNVNNKEINKKAKVEEADEVVQEKIVDETEKTDNVDVQKEDSKKTTKNNSNKTKVVIIIVFTIIAILITGGLLVYKYINRNNEDKANTNEILAPNKQSEDLKHLSDFKDMYSINPIEITYKEYTKGKIKDDGIEHDKIDIDYVQISGLKDKELQKRINDEIKEMVFEGSDKINSKQRYWATAEVCGNFSNILSISITKDLIEIGKEENNYQSDGLNYNLATGEKIKFLDLFASNTPMNSILYDIAYEKLAWDVDINLDMSEEELDKATNMDNRDTSEYEDKLLQVINNYKKLDKDSIVFTVSPTGVWADMDIDGNTKELESYGINFYEYKDYIIAYKKFLTNKDIYENKVKYNYYVFNDYYDYTPLYYKLEPDNLFISAFDTMVYSDEDEAKEYSQKVVDLKNSLVKKKLDEAIESAKKIASKNKNKNGYVSRFMNFSEISICENDYGSEALICVNIRSSLEEMKLDYFKDNVLRILVEQRNAPNTSIDLVLLGPIDYENKNIKLLNNKDEMGYYDLDEYYTLDGKLIAKSYDELQKYLDNKYKAPEIEEEVEPEVNEDEGVVIYGEE